jgi:phosphate transport system ATP-binding protein
MSIAENVLFGVRFHRHWRGRSAAAIVDDALARAGLLDEVKDRLREPAARLSVGQLQRLCIARALANEPEALLLDEPCSALDPVSTQRIEATLRALAAEMPIVLVTHHVAQARRVAHQAVVLMDGRVASAGPPAVALGPGIDPRVADFVGGRSA